MYDDGEISQMMSDENKKLGRQINDLTRLLCEACEKLDPGSLSQLQLTEKDRSMSSELRKWWEEHQENDRIMREVKARAEAHEKFRIESERDRNEAMKRVLAKLSPAEQKLLGIEYRGKSRR
jgi:hypothetical protein